MLVARLRPAPESGSIAPILMISGFLPQPAGRAKAKQAAAQAMRRRTEVLMSGPPGSNRRPSSYQIKAVVKNAFSMHCSPACFSHYKEPIDERYSINSYGYAMRSCRIQGGSDGGGRHADLSGLHVRVPGRRSRGGSFRGQGRGVHLHENGQSHGPGLRARRRDARGGLRGARLRLGNGGDPYDLRGASPRGRPRRMLGDRVRADADASRGCHVAFRHRIDLRRHVRSRRGEARDAARDEARLRRDSGKSGSRRERSRGHRGYRAQGRGRRSPSTTPS